MRRQSLLGVLLTAAAAIPAAADDRGDHRGNPGYVYGRDDRGYDYGPAGRGYGRDNNYGNYGRQYPGGNPVTAAMRDLESLFRRARVDNHEANHFRQALRGLAEFEQRAARGRFDRGILNHVIDNMADLAQAEQLHPRDRQLIRRRLEELRYFRERGARF